MAREQKDSCPACQLWRLPFMEPAPAAQLPHCHQTLQQLHGVRDALTVMSDLLLFFSVIQMQQLGNYDAQSGLATKPFIVPSTCKQFNLNVWPQGTVKWLYRAMAL